MEYAWYKRDSVRLTKKIINHTQYYNNKETSKPSGLTPYRKVTIHMYMNAYLTYEIHTYYDITNLTKINIVS